MVSVISVVKIASGYLAKACVISLWFAWFFFVLTQFVHHRVKAVVFGDDAVKVSRKEFDAMLERAIAELPPAFAQWLEEVPVIVEDYPSRKMLADFGVDDEGELLGSYHGVAFTHRSVEADGQLPDAIYLFRDPLMEECDDPEELAEEIRITLLHEIGHLAGFDEDELEEKGYG